MCKPDAVERGLVGEIVSRIERKGLRLVAAELRQVERAHAEQHYAEHREKPFFGELVAFLTRSPVFAMVVEGPGDNTYALVRKLVGATKVEDAEADTIRGYCAAVRSALTDDGRPPLDASGLKLADRLPKVAESLDRVAVKRGSRRS